MTALKGYAAPNSDPFANRTFVKNCLASGSIVAPVGEGASVRRQDYAVGLFVIVLGLLIAGAFIAAAFWRW